MGTVPYLVAAVLGQLPFLLEERRLGKVLESSRPESGIC